MEREFFQNPEREQHLAEMRSYLTKDSLDQSIQEEQGRTGQDWIVCFATCLSVARLNLAMNEEFFNSEKYQELFGRLEALIAEARTFHTKENRGNKDFPHAEVREHLVKSLVDLGKQI